ncbi:hypothetical protein KY289_004172 [Solanum tuberosum]|nr:hypothetical protein KY289_004172 [Solanum tuberosum]
MTEEVSSRRTCDQINNLPNNTIDAIITRFPMRDAVRTSILSRKWRFDWAKKDLSTRGVRVKLGRSLLHLFSLRQGPISECRISIPKSKYFPEVDNLIFFLSRNEIDYLVFELPKGQKYKFALFYFHKFKDETIDTSLLCNQSPNHLSMLEDREMDISNPLNYIQVNAPNLKFMNFGRKIISICFKSTPLLADVSIMTANVNHGPLDSIVVDDVNHGSMELVVADGVNHGPIELIVADDVNCDFMERGTCNLVKFFGSLPALKNLFLGHSIIKICVAVDPSVAFVGIADQLGDSPIGSVHRHLSQPLASSCFSPLGDEILLRGTSLRRTDCSFLPPI